MDQQCVNSHSENSEHWPQLQEQTHVKNVDAMYSAATACAQEQQQLAWKDVIVRSSGDANAQGRAPPKRKAASEQRRLVRLAVKDTREVTGKADADSNNRVKVSSKVKRLFVYRLDKSCDEEAIKAYMRTRNAPPKQVRCTSKKEWLTNSFCVAINEAYF